MPRMPTESTNLDDYSLTILDLEGGPKKKLKGTLTKQKEVRLTHEDPWQKVR
jgi:hypothetical protein